MKKNNKLIFLSIMMFFAFSSKINAATLSISASSYSVNKNETITISATISSNVHVYYSQGTIKCTGAGVNSNLDLSNGKDPNLSTSISKSFSIKPTSSGTITCSSTNVSAIEGTDPNNFNSVSNKSISINVKAPAVIPPKEYSSNNYLKLLSIEGYEISFDKETLEYSIEVENGVEKVNIKATTEDSSASVSGTGEKEVTEGNNKLEVKVIAENGNERTYVINVKVKELDPINVKVDNEEYTVIRKENVLEVPKSYEKTTVTIDGEEVLAYYNKNTKYTLVGLKDKEGNANYYIYDNGKYTLYKEYTFNGITLYLTDKKVDLPNFKKTSFNYNDNKIEAYQLSEDKLSGSSEKFYLFYAVNIETGKENLYQYDPSEGTVQKYSSSMMNLLEVYKEEANRNFILFVAVSVVLVLLIVIKIITAIIKRKKDSNGINKKGKLNVKEIDL